MCPKFSSYPNEVSEGFVALNLNMHLWWSRLFYLAAWYRGSRDPLASRDSLYEGSLFKLATYVVYVEWPQFTRLVSTIRLKNLAKCH